VHEPRAAVGGRSPGSGGGRVRGGLEHAVADLRGDVVHGAGAVRDEDGGGARRGADVPDGVEVLRGEDHVHDGLVVGHEAAEALDDGLALARDADARQVLDSASPSTRFTCWILSASARSAAATRSRAAALMWFMARFTTSSGSMSTISVCTISYPYMAIALASSSSTARATSFFCSNTWSRFMFVSPAARR